MKNVSLREHIERIFHEKQVALDAALRSQREALIERQQVLESRLLALNELRADVVKDRSLYLTRIEYDAKHDALEQLVYATEKTLLSEINRNRESINDGLAGISKSLNDGLNDLNGWRLRATGAFLVLVPIAGVIGGVIVKVFS